MFGAELWKLLSVTLVLGIDRRASQSFGPYTQYVKVSISQHFFCVFFCFCVVSLSVSVAYQCDIPGGLRLLREVTSTQKLIASQHNYYNTEWSLVMPQRERSKWWRKMDPYYGAIKLTFVMNINNVTLTSIWPDISNLRHKQYKYM